VAVHYGNNRAAAQETVDLIGAAGGVAFPLGQPLGEDGDAAALFEQFDAVAAERSRSGGLDILVNNAAITEQAAWQRPHPRAMTGCSPSTHARRSS
jgi:3-oxoacyl-[acyl-carrier protein] reductase